MRKLLLQSHRPPDVRSKHVKLIPQKLYVLRFEWRQEITGIHASGLQRLIFAKNLLERLVASEKGVPLFVIVWVYTRYSKNCIDVMQGSIEQCRYSSVKIFTPKESGGEVFVVFSLLEVCVFGRQILSRE